MDRELSGLSLDCHGSEILTGGNEIMKNNAMGMVQPAGKLRADIFSIIVLSIYSHLLSNLLRNWLKGMYNLFVVYGDENNDNKDDG